MIHVDMQEFLRTGEFGPFRLGMSRADVATCLGISEQQFVSRITDKLKGAYIWHDGRIEFHHDSYRDALMLIYSGEFTDLTGGATIDLASWIVRGGLSRSEFLAALQAAKIVYQQVHFYDGVHVITQGGVQLYFEERPQRQTLRLGLYNFSYGAPTHFGNPRGIPLNYELIGQIEHFWDRAGVVGVRLLPDIELKAGETVAFHFPPSSGPTYMQPQAFAFLEEFERQTVDEVRINAPPTSASSGSLITFQTPLTKQQARKNTKVYRILPE